MNSPSDSAAARAINVSKIYGHDDSEVRALDDVTIQFEKGHFTAIMGPSGSGKSTLMHCMAGLDSLTTGSVAINGIELSGLSDKALTQLRREQIGFIFQDPMTSLNPVLKIGYQLAEPMREHLGMSRKKAHQRSVELLDFT